MLNVRIRMIRDLLRLDADPGLFLKKTMEDLEFIDAVLEKLLESLTGNVRLLDRETEFDTLSDIEWQFTQLLTECTNASNPFIAGIGEEATPELRSRIFRLQQDSAARRAIIDQNSGAPEHARTEPMVSSLELNELLREF